MKLLSGIFVNMLALLALTVSCGKNSGTSGSNPGAQAEEAPLPAETIATDGSNINGLYLATFTTLNPHVNGTIPGSVTIKRDQDRLFFYVRLFAGAPKVWHPQNVYLGNRCPTLADDTNGDGFIDINEALNVVGKIIIPLDANINNQRAGRNFYPVGDLSGNYFYERITSFRRFFDDLKDHDTDPDDNVAKLGPDEGLQLEGKVVIIQGINPEIELPETVGSQGRYKPQQLLPIACGVFANVPDVQPGSPDDGQIPGPVADVVEGQDRPASDTPIDESAGGTSGNTTNDATNGETPVASETPGGGRTNTRTTPVETDEPPRRAPRIEIPIPEIPFPIPRVNPETPERETENETPIERSESESSEEIG
jgi:hypothetical protein